MLLAVDKKYWKESLKRRFDLLPWILCLVLEAARIILCVCLVLSSLQTRGTSWKSLPFQNLFKDGEEKMFFLFPKGWSWAGHKKGTTFLGSQDRDDPLLENNFLLCKKCRFCTKIKIPQLFPIYWGPGGCQHHLVSFLGPYLFRPGVYQWCLHSFKTFAKYAS